MWIEIHCSSLQRGDFVRFTGKQRIIEMIKDTRLQIMKHEHEVVQSEHGEMDLMCQTNLNIEAIQIINKEQVHVHQQMNKKHNCGNNIKPPIELPYKTI